MATFRNGLPLRAAAALLLASCAGLPERPAPPPVPDAVMGAGFHDAARLSGFLLAGNPALDGARARELAALYVEECAAEGVNHDVAFAQMCLETGFLRFGGLVTADMHNYCGLGSIGPGRPGERFPDARTGVRAHAQHLKAYATAEPLRRPLADPRYRYVRLGSAPTVAALSGRWAADPEYGAKIRAVLARLYGLSTSR